MGNKHYQKVNRNIAKHDPRELAQTESLAPDLDDIDNNGDNCDSVFERRGEFTPASLRWKAHQRRAQLLRTRTRGPVQGFLNTSWAHRGVPLKAVQLVSRQEYPRWSQDRM